MSKEPKTKPVFHQATDEPKEEFRPHHAGGEEEFEGSHTELNLQADKTDLSPDEEKIIQPDVSVPELARAPDPLQGWKLIGEGQQNGTAYLVTHNFYEAGEIAFWRRTRVLSHFKWKLHGKWSNSLTRADIIPEPLYYKDIK